MESKLKITFWLRNSKKLSNNSIPVYLRVRYNGDFFIRATGVYVNENEWDKKSMRVRGLTDNADTANLQLDSLRIKIIQIFNKLLVSNEAFNIGTLKDHLEGKKSYQKTILNLFDEQLGEMKRLKGKEFEQATITKYANTQLRILQFIRSKYKRNDLYLNELNYNFISDWIVFLRTEFSNSTTTCYKHYQRLTRVLRKAILYGYLDKHPFPTYTIRMPKKRIEFLTLDELTSIENSDFKIERLNNIRDTFIFCCYTGLAYAEVEKLSSEDITRGIDGDLWISVMRKKTKKHYDIPLLPKSMQIIKKYSNHPQCIKKGRLLPVPSNVKFNAYLKEIAAIAGIKKNLTSHIARKTFASTIMLGNGVNIAVLSKLLGHASVQVTLDAYASVADELMMKNVRDLKEKLKKVDDELDSAKTNENL